MINFNKLFLTLIILSCIQLSIVSNYEPNLIYFKYAFKIILKITTNVNVILL